MLALFYFKIMPFIPEITTANVKQVAILAAENVDQHIANAGIFMDAAFAGVTISEPLFRLIGVYMAAHFAFVQEGQLKAEGVDVLSSTFNMTSGLALNSTTHGQQAIALDYTGTIAALNAQAKRSGSSNTDKAKKACISII